MDINDAWKSTCHVVLGGEIGEMKEFEQYLQRHQYCNYQQKKSVSGKSVIVGADRYCKNSRFISQDEIDYNQKYAPLSINEIKDIDSLMAALSDRFNYAGSKIFGETKFAEDVDNVTDSFYVYKSHTIVSSKYVAYSSFIREGSEYVFGSSVSIGASHVLKVLGSANLTRSFECNMTTNSSDMFFCHNCTGSTLCMFCFNLVFKKYCIGNLELPRDSYLALKGKLAKEARDYLRKHKSFHSLYDFSPPTSRLLGAISLPKKPEPKPDARPVEKAFGETTRLIFGRTLSGIDRYEKFLTPNVEKVMKVVSPFGTTVPYSNYFWSRQVPKERAVSQDEALALGGRRISLAEGESASIGSLLGKLTGIAFYTVEFEQGQNRNNIECPTRYHSTDCYRVCDATYSKKCGYCTHMQHSDSLFGCGILMVKCSHCIRSHDCVNCSSSLDLDSCKNCYRSMFCHNCENLQDCMFCFNAKNMKYAVGNVEIGREKYMELREKVIAELLSRLEKHGDFGFDICNLVLGGK